MNLMTPHVPSYNFYMRNSAGTAKGNLRINSCFLCHAIRTYPDNRTVYLCQSNRWPSLNAHLACWNHAAEQLREAFPDNAFVESLG